MSAHNLINIYMHEEFKEHQQSMILNSLFTLLFELPHLRTRPIQIASVALQIISQTKDSGHASFKQFVSAFEQAIASMYQQFYELDLELQDRLFNMTAYYISQREFKTDELLQ